MKEIRLGTIGSGVIVHSILDNVARTEGIMLEAVYSRSEEKGRALATQYGASKVYTDMDAFLADEAVNLVYIATPNLLHYEQAKRALLAGKNVLLEKPFCPRVAEARELVNLAKEKGLFLVDAVPTAFLPNFELLKNELPKIGNIKLVLANYSQYSSRYDKLLEFQGGVGQKGELPNIFNPDYAGGCLMDINFYNVYLNVALFGKPTGAQYHPNLFECHQGKKIDTSGIMLMQYPGFVSEAAGAKDTWGVNAFQIQGEKGHISIENGSNGIASVRVVTKTDDHTLNEQSDPDRWYYEVQNVTRLLLADDYEAIYARLDVMLAVIETIETARRNAGILFPGD